MPETTLGKRAGQLFSSSDLWAVGLLVLATLAFFYQIVFQKHLFWGSDIDFFFYPTRGEWGRALRAGHPLSILWSPNIFGGYPLFAEGQTGVLYPLNLLFGLPSPSPLAIYNFLIVLHYFLACAFMFAYARVIDISRGGALIAGLTFGFSGFPTAHLVHMSMMNATPWLPLLFLFAELLLRTGEWRFLLLAGLTLGVQISAGHPQVALMSILSLLGYMVLRTASFRRGRCAEPGGGASIAGRKDFWNPAQLGALALSRPLVLFSMLVAVGVCLAAVQLYPLLELAGRSVRPGGSIEYSEAVSFSLPVGNLATLLFPFYFGGPGLGYRGEWNFWELSFYVGVVPIVLAIVGLVLRPNRYTWIFVTLAGVSLLLAFGDSTPLFGLLHRLPIYKGLRAPARFVLIVDFALAVLAGLSVSNLDKLHVIHKRHPLALSAVSLAFLTSLSLLVFLLWRRSPAAAAEGRYSRISPYLFLFAAGAVLSVARWKPRTRWIPILLLSLLLPDLFLFTKRVNAYVCHESRKANRGPGNELAKFLKTARGTRRVFNLGASPSNAFLRFEIPCLDGYSPLQPLRQREYEMSILSPPVTLSLLAAASTGYVIDHSGAFQQTAKASGLPVVFQDGRNLVYPVPYPRPRAFVVHSAIVASGLDGLQLFRLGRIDAARTVVLGEPFETSRLSGTGRGTAEVTGDTGDRLEVRAFADSDGFLVLSDAEYPGWKAYVDGRETKIFQANYMFRAVFLPAGEHVVQFVFRPTSVLVGFAVSVLTLLLVGGAFLRMAFAARPPGPLPAIGH